MIELRTLGQLGLKGLDGRACPTILAQPKRFALLVYLAVSNHHRSRRRDSLVALFWPELDTDHARGALRQALRFLRRELGDGIVIGRNEEALQLEGSALWCDALLFENACRVGDHAAALALYRGDFLEGLFVADAATDLDHWLQDERARLRRLAGHSAWAVAEQSRVAGDRQAAVALARRAAGFAPGDEGELARLMTFLDTLGDRAGALAAYVEFARQLKQEYGADPSPETQAVLLRIRSRAISTAVLDGAPHQTPAQAAAERESGHGGPPPLAGVRHGRPRSRTSLALLGGVGILALGAYLWAFVGGRRAHADASHVVVAVLPLQDLSGDTGQAYVAEGMTDQLITDLAQVRALQVINRRTMMVYRGSKKRVRDIARELKADAVIAGTVQRLGDTLHVTAQLVLADRDRIVWANSYEGTRGDLLRMQREVARAAAERMRGVLNPSERAGLGGTRAVDPTAMELYVKGRYWWNKRDRANLLKAVDAFDQALDIDPTFAPAYSGIGDAYVQLGYGGFLTPDDAFPKAEAAARRALQLDSTLAEPHAVLGYASMYFDWNWAAADREFQLALARNPSYATGHEWYGLFLAAMGRFAEAQAHERRAQVLDPLSTAIAGTAGWVLHYSGKQEEAAGQLRTALRVDSTFAIGHLYLGRVHQAEGRLDSAAAHYAATGRLKNWVPTIAGLGNLYGQQGRRREARAMLARLDSLSRTEYVTAYGVALVHTGLGDRDRAFAWLDKAVRERSHWLVWLNRDRRWDPLRSDTRFQAVVKRVGLPP